MLATYLRAGEAPDVDRVRMLNILATELAPALEGARLRSRLVASVNSARQTADTPQDLYGVLDRALSIMMEGWNADAGAILLSAGEPPAWDARTQRNFGDLGGERFALALRLAGLARERRAPVVIPRMRAPHGLRSIAAIPLEAEGQVLGVAVMASEVDGQFALHQTDVLEALGANLALVIRNAQLYHRLREMAVLEERYRISREIHDGLAQTLGYLGLQVDRVRSLLQRGQYHDAAQEVGALHEVIREAYLDVRETIDHLRVSAEGEGGIVGALERLARDFTQRSGITVRTRLEARDASLAPEVELHLLRIAQEALTNVRKHSGARHVEMGLTRDERFVELSIADAGRGFDPAALPPSHHHGLASMRERAAICGGQLSIVTGPGKGTRVVVRMPTMGGHSDGSTRARRG
ncbi:MAG: GAF domain-containing sensor histidine kinase [Limnochordaceae bacterium]|nr:GAF domain-containing sensor histidine kinase [Limnochordaceae bacterium]